MNYLITGTSGFIGKALTKALIANGHNVYGIDLEPVDDSSTPGFTHYKCDITDLSLLTSILANIRLDGVFHLAAQSSVKTSWSFPIQTYEINAVGTSSLVETLKKCYGSNPPKLLFCSSSEVYGSLSGKETCREENELSPVNPYGISKMFAEKIITASYPKYSIIRPFSIIGPGQDENFVVPNFCKQVAAIIKNEAPPYLHVGNLKVLRNFIDLDDAIDAFIKIIDVRACNTVYNLASKESVSLEQMVQLLKEISNINFEVKTEESRMRPVEVQNTNISIDKLTNIGWEPSTKLKDSLNKILSLFL